MANGGTVLVVSAHAGDFVWRAGGAIAAATARGDRAVVVCLYYTSLAVRRGVQVKRNPGPNLGLPVDTKGEAYMRYPQVTEVLE